MLRLSHRLMFLLCLLLVPPLLAQGTMGGTLTRDDQIGIAAPTWSGETGLFTTVTANTLHRGDFSFGIYAQNWRVTAGPARAFTLPSARPYKDYGYDHDMVSLSAVFGLTDRWEISGMLPYERIRGQGGDRAGFIMDGFTGVVLPTVALAISIWRPNSASAPPERVGRVWRF